MTSIFESRNTNILSWKSITLLLFFKTKSTVPSCMIALCEKRVSFKIKRFEGLTSLRQTAMTTAKVSPWIMLATYYDIIKWKHFPRYWQFVREIHRSPVNSSHKGQWRGAVMFSLICAWIRAWVNNREAGDLRRHRAHYDVTVMTHEYLTPQKCLFYPFPSILSYMAPARLASKDKE